VRSEGGDGSQSSKQQGNYTVPDQFNSNVSIALTHPHHFVLRVNTCDNIDTAVYIWRVLDVR